MKQSVLITSIALAIGLSGSVMATEIEQSQTKAGLQWTVDGAWGGAKLKVFDGDQVVFERIFKAGSRLAMPFSEMEAAGLTDGQYSFELVVSPQLSQDDLVEMQVSREIGTADSRFVKLPEAMPVASGTFSMDLGQVVDPELMEPSKKDQVIADDLIVQFSACIGNDCVNGESFGFDTLRLKENNTRIKFQDTSNSASFPTNDWQLTANDSSNGGANKFSIDDIDGNKTPFTITAGARTNSIFVNNAGRVGFGTATPVVDLHVKQGNSPALRLEQDGSSGFTPQTWDLAGNETNFFIRDVTNGSNLPFRIRPSAPGNSIYVDSDGDIGFGTASPSNGVGDAINTQAKIHVRSTESNAARSGLLYVENASGTAGFRYLFALDNGAGGGVAFRVVDGDVAIDTNNIGGEYRINFDDGDNQELTLDADGNLAIDGQLTTATQTIPDYVFEEDYALMPLADLQGFIDTNGHLPRIPSADEYAQRGGVNVSELQILLLEKVEELTLYTLEQDARIKQLESILDDR